MPFVDINPSLGPLSIYYIISTPDSDNATCLDPSLPTVIFLHPAYIPQSVFHSQFADPIMRRFNLLALDMRGHGHTVGHVPKNYRCNGAAEDISEFMDALKLPPCHFYGIGVGGSIALQLATVSPEKVLSIFTVSPIPLEEPDIVISGRQDVYECWVAALATEPLDEDMLYQTVVGGMQHAFSGSSEPLVVAAVQAILPKCLENWKPSRFEEFHTLSTEFYADFKPPSIPELQKVKVPVHLVHCGEDIAYSLEMIEELRNYLVKGGVDVHLVNLQGPTNVGVLTHPELIDKLSHELILSLTPNPIPPSKSSVTSPYEEDYRKAGYGLSFDPEELVPIPPPK